MNLSSLRNARLAEMVNDRVAVLQLTTPWGLMRPSQALALLDDLQMAGWRIVFQGQDFVIVSEMRWMREL